jgi:hypothetical protein
LLGGAAGHFAGHHGLIGAAAGCAIGHHEANKPQNTQPTTTGSVRWSRLSEQIFRVDKWSACRG